MTQNISFAYQDAATSRQANRRVASAIDPGVYQGYFPVVSTSSPTPNRIDLTLGNDGVSVAITSEGVRIEENSILAGIVQFVNPDATRERYDLVVVEYQYTTDRNIPAVYKIVQGSYAAVGTTPILPPTQNAYQVAICYVRIRPQTPTGGPTLVSLVQDDLLPVIRGQDVSHPQEMGALKPVLNPADSNKRTLFVYPGSFPAADRSTIVDFFGGYSEDIIANTTVAAMTVGQVQYWAVGITDNGAVDLFEQLTGLTENPANVETALPLCVLEIRNVSGTPAITQLRDIRQFVARLGTGSDELDQWRDMFAATVFEDMVFDPYTDLDRVDETTLTDTGATPNLSGITLSLDQAQSAILLRCDGVNVPTGDVELVVGDILSAAGFASVREFVVLALHDVPGIGTAGLQYRYSFTGPTGGFQPDPSQPAHVLNNNTDSPIVATPGASPSNLYVKLIFPNGLFPAGSAVEYRIFSLGVLANIDPAVAAADKLLDDARTTLENSVFNLIANDFAYWSYPNETSFVAPDDPSFGSFSTFISGVAGDITAGKNQVGPDGWQAVWKDAGNIDKVDLRRATYTSPILDRRFKLSTQIMAISATPGEFIMEYRVPASRVRIGDAVSFAIDVDTVTPGAAGISIRLYSRASSGALQIDMEVPAIYAGSGASRLVGTTGGVKIDPQHVAIGFIIRLKQSTSAAVSATWHNPTGCAGEFETVLPFSPPRDPLSELQHYVSVHRLLQRGYASEPSQVGFSAPITPKYRVLGSLRATMATLSSSQNSVNVGNLAPAVDDFGQSLSIEGDTIQAGQYAIDSVVLADILYEKDA